MAKRGSIYVQVVPILKVTFQMVIHAINLMARLLQYAINGAILEDNLRATAGPKFSNEAAIQHSYVSSMH